MKTVVAMYDDTTIARDVDNDLVNTGVDSENTRVIESASDVWDGIVSSLHNWGVPQNEAQYYAEGVRRGGTLVTAQVGDERVDEAIQIMERYNPVDLQRRAQTWRESGSTGFNGEGEAHRERTVEGKETIEVVEEDVKVGKREVEQGGVRVRSYVREVPVEEDVHLREEHVHVDRRPVDRPATEKDLDSFEEKTIEMTETAEEAVVSKEARVTEEVVVGKDVEEHVETVHDTVRRVEVEVDEMDADATRRTEYATVEPEFRSHYESTYGTTDYTYDQYEPAYEYGHALALSSAYRNRDWKDVEPEARRRWEERNPGTWNQFKDAIHHAWIRAKSNV